MREAASPPLSAEGRSDNQKEVQPGAGCEPYFV